MKSMLAVLCVVVCLGAIALSPAIAQKADEIPSDMVYIKKGVYKPLFKDKDGKAAVPVPAFLLDKYPVTNGEFLEFVRNNPKWQRSKVKPIFADHSYLSHWAGDLNLGSVSPQSPVTNVSWFAARAYAKWKGKRLPSTAEWEYAAAASEKNTDGTKDSSYTRRILSWYAKPTPRRLPNVGGNFKNVWGAYDMHGVIWEWVDDFSTALVNGDSRNDTGVERNLFCGSASVRASDTENYAAFMRYGFRSSLTAHYCVQNLGFRCARDVELSVSSQ